MNYFSFDFKILFGLKYKRKTYIVDIQFDNIEKQIITFNISFMNNTFKISTIVKLTFLS